MRGAAVATASKVWQQILQTLTASAPDIALLTLRNIGSYIGIILFGLEYLFVDDFVFRGHHFFVLLFAFWIFLIHDCMFNLCCI